MDYPEKIILAGFMGTGKSAVGQRLAKRLKVPFIDTDERVEKTSGKPIPSIFEQDGEKSFRQWENRALAGALAGPKAVIAVGGGAICSKKNLKKAKDSGLLVLLRAEPKTVLKRISSEAGTRPLLKVSNPAQAIEKLLAKREPFYNQIPWQVSTDGRSKAQVAQLIYAQLPLQKGAIWVNLGERRYPLYFQRGGHALLPDLIQQHCPTGRLVLITDSNVDRRHGRSLYKALRTRFQVKKLVVPAGEKYKTLKTVQGLYKELIRYKVDRKTPLLALGGGVLGDVVGYTAASFLRGVPFVQVPTTLIAQVDSSIGGKTGVDLPEGKNLIGAFYQPKFVFIDVDYLRTLDARQLICGMAEVIKYGAIFDKKLFRQLEENMPLLLKDPGGPMEEIVRRCCEWKAWVVEEDELEARGIRSQLNFGHTLGHAIESLTGYRKFTHGEAIAMGMAYAAERSVQRTGLWPGEAQRLRALLEKTGLPTQLPPLGRKEYERALIQDKKRVSGQLNFVYLKRLGRAEVLPTPLDEVL